MIIRDHGENHMLKFFGVAELNGNLKICRLKCVMSISRFI